MAKTSNGTFKKSGIPIPIGWEGCEFGDVYFVDYANGSDSNRGLTPGTAFKKYSKAVSACTSNQNDAIFVQGYSTVTETAMIDFTKNRVHTFGCNGPLPIFGAGAGAKINIGVTTNTADIALIKNTGVRNSWTGIKFSSDNTLTEGIFVIAEGGEYSRYNHCEVYKSTHLTDTALAAEVLCNGDAAEFNYCTVGDLVNSKGASSVPRANINICRETITGKVARDVTFNHCIFLQKAAHADANFVYGSGTTDVERRMLFISPVFWNCTLSAATIADGITMGGACTTGDILLLDPVGIKVTAFAEASQNVFVQGSVPTAATSGIAVEIAE